ncbi:hypothetical protein EVA_12637 [gut metagenome]|uniref:Uncharacterized protein n=1 Tax=gut metagenome TaxID=749906 RepID=J9GIC3_9ZZZZ
MTVSSALLLRSFQLSGNGPATSLHPGLKLLYMSAPDRIVAFSSLSTQTNIPATRLLRTRK